MLMLELLVVVVLITTWTEYLKLQTLQIINYKCKFICRQTVEKLQEAQKDKIGSDVVSKLIINYMKWSPKYDSCGDVIGSECVNISEASPEGDIPDMMRKKLAERQSMAMEAVAAFVRKQWSWPITFKTNF